MTAFSKVQYGDGLEVTDLGGGIIRIDGAGAVGPAGPAGVDGADGATGPAGPPGPAGTDANYVYTQTGPSASWSVTHGLGKFPAVSVVDSGGSWVIPDVLYVDTNHVTLGFSSPTSGKAVFN